LFTVEVSDTTGEAIKNQSWYHITLSSFPMFEFRK